MASPSKLHRGSAGTRARQKRPRCRACGPIVPPHETARNGNRYHLPKRILKQNKALCPPQQSYTTGPAAVSLSAVLPKRRKFCRNRAASSTRLSFIRFELPPRAPGIQYFRRDIGTMPRYVKLKNRIDAGTHVLQITLQCGPNHGTSQRQTNPLSDAIRTARPSGIDHVNVGSVLLQPFAEHLGVAQRGQGQKRFTKAGGERRHRLIDAAFGAGKLARIAGEEVIKRLIRIQSGNRWQYTKRIGGQKAYRLRMSANARNHRHSSTCPSDDAAGCFRSRWRRGNPAPPCCHR